MCKKKCLIIKIGALGDVLRITPIIHTLNDLDYKIDIITSPIGKQIITNNPFVKSIYKIKHYHNFIELFLLFRKIKKRSYDLLLNFESNSKIIKKIENIHCGQYIDYRQIKDTEYLNTNDFFYKYIDVITQDSTYKKYANEIYPLAPETQKIINYLSIYNDKKKIAIHSGTSKTNRLFIKNKKDVRLWQKNHIIELIKYLINDNYYIFLTGAKNEFKINEDIIEAVDKNKNVINTAGLFNVQELYVFIGLMDWFVSDDTGPAHIAAGTKVKQICLCGPTDGRYSAPPSRQNLFILQKNPENCSPCYADDKKRRDSCSFNKCMDNIKPIDVINIIKEERNGDASN